MDNLSEKTESLHWKILSQLADGQLHSGQAIAQQLGVTRAAIWKALKKLEQFDVAVEHQRGVGYQLSTGQLELLNSKKIQAAMPAHSADELTGLRLFRDIPSTNQYLLDEQISQANGPLACFAEYQSAGRGRRGRRWYSPFGANLYFSLAWPVRSAAADLAGLSLAVGVVVAEVLSALGLQGVGLKWPNDLLIKNKKLGGILIDLRGEANGIIWVVIGIGINVNMQSATDAAIDQPWVSCEQVLGKKLSRNRLGGLLIASLLSALKVFEVEGFGAFRHRWQQLDLLAGKPVWVEIAGEKVSAVATGVDASGALTIDYQDSSMTLNGGEVTVRCQRGVYELGQGRVSEPLPGGLIDGVTFDRPGVHSVPREVDQGGLGNGLRGERDQEKDEEGGRERTHETSPVGAIPAQRLSITSRP